MSFVHDEKKSAELHHKHGFKTLVIGQALAGAATSVPKATYMSMMNMINPNSMLNLLEKHQIVSSIKILGDFPIDTNRCRFVEDSVEAGADYLFFMDMDQTFPPNTIELLFESISDERPVVSGMYFLKQEPYSPVMGRYVDWDDEMLPYKDQFDKMGFVHPDGRQLVLWRAFTYFDRVGLFRADVIGLGCMLIKTSVFAHLEKPYFFYSRDPRPSMKHKVMDEVMPFCANLAKAGIPIWIDPRVQCGHLTQVESNREIYESFRDAQFAESAKREPEKFNALTELFIDVRKEQRDGDTSTPVGSSRIESSESGGSTPTSFPGLKRAKSVFGTARKDEVGSDQHCEANK